MPDEETLDRRLRAVERSLTDGDHDLDALRDAATRIERVESLERWLADTEDRVTELEAATQALRGYVGSVRSVNEDVEQRADAALAAVERLEAQIDGGGTTSTSPRAPVRHSDSENPRTRSPVRQSCESDGSDESDGVGIVARVRDSF